MTTPTLSNDEFFTRLAALFSTATSKSHSTVYISQKPLPAAAAAGNDPPPTTTPSPTPLLVRASNGASKKARKDDPTKKIKLRTIVQPDAIEGFYARYTEVAKSGMASLKKRDRKGKKLKARKKGKAPVGGVAATT